MNVSSLTASLAPEPLQELRAAQAALEKAALRAEHNQDETGAWLRAQAVAIGALRQALVDFTASNAALAEKAKQPIDNDTLRFAVIKGVEAHANAAVRAISARNTILAVTALLVVAAIGFAGGWLTSQNQLVAVSELSAAIRAKEIIMILATTTVEDVDRFLKVFGTTGADSALCTDRKAPPSSRPG